MSHDTTTAPRSALSIGLVAYGVDGPNPSLVFVRVPTERGRWVLTDRCVVEVACDYCGAVVGEPCRRSGRLSGYPARPLAHGATTHVIRRDAWQRLKYSTPRWRETPRLRVPAADLDAALSTTPDGASDA